MKDFNTDHDKVTHMLGALEAPVNADPPWQIRLTDNENIPYCSSQQATYFD